MSSAAGDPANEMAAAQTRLERARATASRLLRRSGEKGRAFTPAPGAVAFPSSEDLPAFERAAIEGSELTRLGAETSFRRMAVTSAQLRRGWDSACVILSFRRNSIAIITSEAW